MRCSKGQIEDFAESNLWKDICDELDIWLEQIHGKMENHGLVAEVRELDRFGGNCESIRNFKDILQVLITNAEIDEEEKGGK